MRIWQDNWLPRDVRLRPYAWKITDLPQWVSGGCWNRPLLEKVFHPLDIEVIESIPISTRGQGEFWAWHFERKGVFLVRSVYRMMVHTKKRRGD
jgi:hypothetical protein